MWLHHPNDDFVYSQDDLDSYVPSEEFLDMMVGLDIGHDAFVKGMEIQRLRPCKGE